MAILHQSAPARRVAVTGAGIITGHGTGWRVNADAVREGRCALGPVTLFDVSRQRTGQACQVQLPSELPPHRLTPREVSRLDRGAHLLIHALHEAVAQDGGDGLTQAPVWMGTSAAAMAHGEEYYKQAAARPLRRTGQLTRATCYQAQHQAAVSCRAVGAAGAVTIVSNACASGANAIGEAFMAVRGGRADKVICGGYDALCQLVFAGFDSLKALSTTLPRPFDAERDGLALGEGAGVLILEEWEAANARGAVLAEICGYGMSTDLHHLTQPDPEGKAALASMNAACRMAGCTPQDIGYINAHGTGTPHNDIAEARAIAGWAQGAPVAVSSTKGGMGHLLGGAGAVEAVLCVMALREQFLPPSTHVRTPDAACTFDLVREPRAAHGLCNVLTNSFGFGGSNATLCLRGTGIEAEEMTNEKGVSA